jgi:hypothetical protein
MHHAHGISSGFISYSSFCSQQLDNILSATQA